MCPEVGANNGEHQTSNINQWGEGGTSTMATRGIITGGKEGVEGDEELLNVEGEGEVLEVLMLKSYKRRLWVKMQLSRRLRP